MCLPKPCTGSVWMIVEELVQPFAFVWNFIFLLSMSINHKAEWKHCPIWELETWGTCWSDTLARQVVRAPADTHSSSEMSSSCWGDTCAALRSLAAAGGLGLVLMELSASVRGWVPAEVVARRDSKADPQPTEKKGVSVLGVVRIA